MLEFKTLNGSFNFKLQRFCDKNKNETANFLFTNEKLSKHYITNGLEELVCRYARDVSYSKSVEVVKDVTGEHQLSDQTIYEIVKEKANEISIEETTHVRKVLIENVMPKINTQIDIYATQEKEIMLQIDGIVSKEQKAKRDNVAKDHKSFVSNTIALLQNKDNGFDCLMGGMEEENGSQANLKEVIQSKIIENYKDSQTPLNMVAINDGAKDIRLLLMEIFGVLIVVILDWYHLTKKVKEYMSMFGLARKDKDKLIKEILHYLWQGKTDSVIEKFKSLEVKNMEKRDDLIGYLEKHKIEIIDYEKRQKTGKTIGSGLIENGVNQIVGRRQKNKGMTWRPKGSKAIAKLKVAAYNKEWGNLWRYKQVV